MRRLLAFVLLVFAGGCATPEPRTPEGSGPLPYLVSEYGKVVRVQSAEGYVVLECAVLPKPGERITLYRNNNISGTVVVTRIIAGRHAAADIADGAPAKGDWYRIDRTKTTEAGTGP